MFIDPDFISQKFIYPIQIWIWIQIFFIYSISIHLKFISQKFTYPIQIWIWIQILIYRPKVYKSKVCIPVSNLNLNSNIFLI